MKTLWTEKDVAFKSDNPRELLDMGLEYLDSPKPGLRNEIEKMIQRCKKEGMQKGTKSSFQAVYDIKRNEYCLFIKDQYEPVCGLAMLFELLTETEYKGSIEEEMQIRKDQINRYLSLIEKNEEIVLANEKGLLEETVAQMLNTLSLYNDDDTMTDEELEALSDKIDQVYFDPINQVIETIMKQLVSGALDCGVDTSEYDF